MNLEPEDLIDLPCDCCGKHVQRIIMVKRGTLTNYPFTLVECQECGFLYFNPRPTEAAIVKLYDRAYYEGKGFDAVTDYVSAYGTDEGSLDPSHHPNPFLVSRLTAFRAPPARLLDFGCGLGDFARLAMAAGYDVEGYEVSPDAREFCAKNGFKVYASPSEIPAASYDIVTAVEVIEHLYAPSTGFSEMFSALKPGGIFLYTTYNPAPFLWKKHVGLVDDNSYILPEGHLNFFNRGVMKRYLQAAGFSGIGEQWAYSTRLKHKMKGFLGLHLPSGIK